MENDLIIGAVNGYEYDNIKHWVNSIDKSGYTGKKAIIAYNMNAETANKLKDRGFMIFAFKVDSAGNLSYDTNIQTFNVVVDRFAHMWHFINSISDHIGYVIATDVRDVVFQTNPSEMVRNMITDNKQLLVGAENFKYKDEPWNVNNMNIVFGPYLFESVKNNPIYCAGVLAGKRQALADLCLNIFLMCRGASPHTPGGGGPDQAALNILLNMEAYFQTTIYTAPFENIIVHLGTTLPAILSGSGEIGQRYKANPNLLDTYKQTMLYSDTKIQEDGTVTNGNGSPYCIVHQYDRVDGLKEKIHNKFNE